MSSIAAMSSTPLTGAIGATIDGLDLRSPDDDDIVAVRSAVFRHRVVFRQQHLGGDELGELAGRFGQRARSPLDALLGRTTTTSVERDHGAAVAAALCRAHRPVCHPLVRRHEVTGELGLFLSPMYLHHLVGIDRQRGARLLRRLDATLVHPHHQVRWRWTAGDLAIWDESTTCHRALADHHPQRRPVRCCVIEGSPPWPAS